MAIHSEKVGLIKESLIELIHVADYAVNYIKTDSSKWGEYALGGILGFPSSIILFSIIDCIGSICAGNKKYLVKIDGKERYIKGTSQHIYILNSDYFSLDLSQLDLDNIYSNYRSTLTHNSLMPEGYRLQIGEKNVSPFQIGINENDKRIYFINIVSLLELTKNAVNRFLNDLDNGTIDFVNSQINQDIMKRDTQSSMYPDPVHPGQYRIKMKKWIKF